MKHKTTRRDFLRTTLYTGMAAGVVSPTLVSAQSQGANDKITCAVVGARGRGGSHIQGFLTNPHTVITYIVDPDEAVGKNRCEQIEKKQGSRPKFVRDMREAYADKDLDAVGSATPNHWHALSAIWAMQAGKDVYVEKPASQNIFEGAVMVAAAKKYGRLCQVGTQCRSNPAIRQGIAYVQSGAIGEVTFARGVCHRRRKAIGALGDYPVPENVDFNLWSGPAIFTQPRVTRPQFHYDWHWQRLYGNGDSGNQGPHQFDIARWGLGLMRHPNKVITYGGRLGYEVEKNDPQYLDAGDTPNTEVSIFDYGDKTIVFETRGLETKATDGANVGVVFYGTEGRLVQVHYGLCVAYDKDGKVVKEFKGGDDQNHYDNFVDAVLKRDAAILTAPILDGHLSAALAHLGNTSYYLGEKNKVSQEEIGKVLETIPSRDDNLKTLARTVEHLQKNGVDLSKTPLALGPQLEFDGAAEKFVNNAEADKWLTRQWREGFECPTAESV
ncbi:MAG: Gfo/Idh/MocA family oxidoreductase [Planctomycetia bacterium]|nr:Gfo/Idh/MocA family oxidoreductase [Planctomycetia bacterium]